MQNEKLPFKIRTESEEDACKWILAIDEAAGGDKRESWKQEAAKVVEGWLLQPHTRPKWEDIDTENNNYIQSQTLIDIACRKADFNMEFGKKGLF